MIAALRTAGAVPSDNPLAEPASVPKDGRRRMRGLARGLHRLRATSVLVLDDFDEITDPRLKAAPRARAR